jgi:hypothetical protein
LLDAKWRALKDLRLAAADAFAIVDFVIVHPDHGIALVVVDRKTSNARTAIRVVQAALRQDGFYARFSGFLPIVFLPISDADFSELPLLLMDSFQRERPISVPHAGWADAALDVIARCNLHEVSATPASSQDTTPASSQNTSAGARPRRAGERRSRNIPAVAALGLIAFAVGAGSTSLIQSWAGGTDDPKPLLQTPRSSPVTFVLSKQSAPPSSDIQHGGDERARSPGNDVEKPGKATRRLN